MERGKFEAVEKEAVESTDSNLRELDETQLALIGGGSGDTILH